MKAIKAVYRNGQIQLAEPPPDADPGPIEVLVVFPEAVDDPWRHILNEPTARPSFAKFAQECLAEIAQGKSTPLNLDDL